MASLASVLALFALSIAAGAALLFVVEPLFARLALPVLGGAPAVWNTALVFYQATLLAGYLYAHLLRRLPRAAQLVVHLPLLAAAFLVLPIAMPAGWAPPADADPVGWLLVVLAVSVGLPFFAVSTTSPLLQEWFARTRHQRSRDPYFLYAASNVGSFLGLVAYPFLLEPYLRLVDQARLWEVAYALLAVLVVACGVVAWRSASAARECAADTERLGWRRRARWVALAAVPSSLLLGVTTYLTTDIASVPLLWVVPLALYLLTFVHAFGGQVLVAQRTLARALPVAVVLMTAFLTANALETGLGPSGVLAGAHLLTFAIVALLLHGALAEDRPGSARLTEFYLWVSLGGVAGGAFNALVAPLIFPTVVEYPLALLAACLVAPGLRPIVRVVASTAVVLFAAYGLVGGSARTLVLERSFFGVHHVVADEQDGLRVYLNGSTLHGSQHTDPARRLETTSYYTSAGPLGDVMRASRGEPVAVVGLGAGTMACLGESGQRVDFYELDPLVAHIARRDFTYLADCPPATRVILGDGRLSLAASSDRYGLVVLDAFTSDAIPVHLLTREALALYLSRLEPHGLMAFHVSNRHLDLEPVLGDLAVADGLVALTREDLDVPQARVEEGASGSTVVVIARTREDLALLASAPGWRDTRTDPSAGVWTDDYSSVFAILR